MDATEEHHEHRELEANAEAMMQSQFGKYTLLDKLGDGGMAEVFLAQIQGPEGFTKLVALKRILPHLTNDDLFTKSFINEARLGGYLNHHNIVQTLEFGQEEKFYYLAMEYVRGVTLADVLAAQKIRRRPLPTDLALQIALQMAEGLAYAHSAEDAEGRPLKMVHRDLKPANILINNHGVCKIADFGVARSETNIQQTMLAGEVKGTVAYMSPEQAMGRRNLDNRSDLYSLGSIFFEMLTNERLYPEDSYLLSLRLVQDGQVADRLPMVLELEQGIRLYQILSKVLALDPEERYASALEFARDLREVLINFNLEWELADYLKALLPNSPLAIKGTMLQVPVGSASGSSPRAQAPAQLHAPPQAERTPPPRERTPPPRERAPAQMERTPPPVERTPPPPMSRPMPGEATLNPPRPPEGAGRAQLGTAPSLEISQNTMNRAKAVRPLWRRPELWIVVAVLAVAGSALAFRMVNSSHSVLLLSVPPQASITSSTGEVLGRAPLKVTVPSDGLTVRVELPGFEVETRTISAAQSGEVEIALVKNRASLEVQVLPPEARVELNGRPLPGTSPFLKKGLAPGRHSLHASLDGYEPVDDSFEIQPGESKSIHLTLMSEREAAQRRPDATRARPERPTQSVARAEAPRPPVETPVHNPTPAPSTPRTAPAPRAEKPAEKPAERAAEKPVEAANGFLTLNAFPYAKVEIDGSPIKTTPLLNHALAAGAHTVKLKTEDGREQTLQINIQAGETTKKIVRFDATP